MMLCCMCNMMTWDMHVLVNTWLNWLLKFALELKEMFMAV